MTKLFLVFLLSIAVNFSATCGDPAEVMAMLKPLVGHTYVGTFPNGEVTDEQRYAWVYGENFIRNNHEVRNGEGKAVYAGETIFALDRKLNKIVFWYWNTTGGFVDGSFEKQGDRLFSNGENNGPSGQVGKVRSAIWDIKESGYKATAYFFKDDTWQEQWTIEFTKKIPAKAAK